MSRARVSRKRPVMVALASLEHKKRWLTHPPRISHADYPCLLPSTARAGAVQDSTVYGRIQPRMHPLCSFDWHDSVESESKALSPFLSAIQTLNPTQWTSPFSVGVMIYPFTMPPDEVPFYFTRRPWCERLVQEQHFVSMVAITLSREDHSNETKGDNTYFITPYPEVATHIQNARPDTPHHLCGTMRDLEFILDRASFIYTYHQPSLYGWLRRPFDPVVQLLRERSSAKPQTLPNDVENVDETHTDDSIATLLVQDAQGIVLAPVDAPASLESAENVGTAAVDGDKQPADDEDSIPVIFEGTNDPDDGEMPSTLKTIWNPIITVDNQPIVLTIDVTKPEYVCREQRAVYWRMKTMGLTDALQKTMHLYPEPTMQQMMQWNATLFSAPVRDDVLSVSGASDLFLRGHWTRLLHHLHVTIHVLGFMMDKWYMQGERLYYEKLGKMHYTSLKWEEGQEYPVGIKH